MARTSVKAFLVGLPYHALSGNQSLLSSVEAVVLRREPTNPHDKNAIAVELSDQKVGYIDRAAAEVLAPMLDAGATYVVSIGAPQSASAKSIPVLVKIELAQKNVAAPRIKTKSLPGIYRIYIPGHAQSYIGQARNMQERIVEHWYDLNRGVHQSRELRRLWSVYGGVSFRVEVLEEAPSFAGQLELSRWLVSRERHWINIFGGIPKTINRIEPKIVLNDVAEKELIVESREQKQAKREQRRKDLEKYEVLKAKLSDSSRTVSRLMQELRSVEERIRAATGLRGLVFSSGAERQKVPSYQGRVDQLKRDIESASKVKAELEAEMNPLKAILYPPRGRRSLNHSWIWSRR